MTVKYSLVFAAGGATIEVQKKLRILYHHNLDGMTDEKEKLMVEEHLAACSRAFPCQYMR